IYLLDRKFRIVLNLLWASKLPYLRYSTTFSFILTEFSSAKLVKLSDLRIRLSKQAINGGIF
ncbi:MAG: hypothetical protein ACK56F_32680, partial [bacterium]